MFGFEGQDEGLICFIEPLVDECMRETSTRRRSMSRNWTMKFET